MKKLFFVYFLSFLAVTMMFGQHDSLKSRAELTNYQSTSLSSDIDRMLNYCRNNSKNILTKTILRSHEGKDIPLVKLFDSTSRVKQKLKVLIIAGVHSGEVDGKEASFVLIRDILFGKLAYLLKDLEIFVIPTLNMDGNDKINRYNRLSQNGPAGGVGLADFPNGMNINRDFSKHEIPETEALIKNVINRYDPEIIIDCHTTNGSYHAYALTYAPPLNPNTNKRITSFLKSDLFPFVTKNLYDKFKYRTQYYGNFKDEKNPEKGWETFNYIPRYSNNYIGLINRIGILSEGYSYLKLEGRIDVTAKFITEILDYAHLNKKKIIKILKQADRDNLKRFSSAKKDSIAVKCTLKEASKPIEIYLGKVDSVKDSDNKGYTFKMVEGYEHLVMCKDFTEFTPLINVSMPYGYLIPKKFENVIQNLMDHNVKISRFKKSVKLRVEKFIIDSLGYSAHTFQAHKPVALRGNASDTMVTAERGDYFISMQQVKSNLIPQLLEPLSGDGYVYWNFFDEYFKLYSSSEKIVYPIFRLMFKKNIRVEKIN